MGERNFNRAEHVANLRARVDALTTFRDQMAGLLTTAEYEGLMRIMVPWTDDLLWDLAAAERDMCDRWTAPERSGS